MKSKDLKLQVLELVSELYSVEMRLKPSENTLVYLFSQNKSVYEALMKLKNNHLLD